MTRAWSGSPANPPLITLRLQRNVGNTVIPVEVTYIYGGVQNKRHTTIREELDLDSGEITTSIIHGGTAK